MPTLGLETEIVDREVLARSVARCREAGIVLPTFAQLAAPQALPPALAARVAAVDPDAPDPANLFRVHWYNPPRGSAAPLALPDYLVLPEALTGVAAPIVVLPADRFPMIHAHKVLPAYTCLAPRLITGQFDPTRHRAVWPSTGNYCRGGVAISRIMGCRGVAVLPEEMSRERFDWLARWVVAPEDVIRTPGSESNVKEIYDKCAELDRDAANIVFNQFSEFGNYLGHFLCTGGALEEVFLHLHAGNSRLRLAAFVSASGSAGTLAAGDRLKERFGAAIVAAEALECPTMLENGFGAHNIQGIGDKHIPLIHNVMNTDLVAAVSDRATDALDVLFNHPEGRAHLERKGVPAALIAELGRFGFSSICNLLAAIMTARRLDLGPDDVLITVATDSAAMYASEHRRTLARDYPRGFGAAEAAEVFGRHLLGVSTEHLLELDSRDRRRIFNLGYFTWVEQQGLSIGEFSVRREQAFWRGLRDLLPAWDALIEEFNRATGLGS